MRSITDPATGKVYRSISAAARAIGISKDGLRHRLACGCSPDLVFYPGKICAVFSRDPAGRDFPTIASMAKAWGLRPKLVCSRLARNLTVEQALAPPRPRRVRKPRNKQEIV